MNSGDHGGNNFATIRTTSIVNKQHKYYLQEEMHEQMTGYKRMRREHQAALLKVIDIFYMNIYELLLIRILFELFLIADTV